ncbi:MAG TPA: hypothetical protein VFB68_17015 [Xanthobacteraceae bacterium]|nr:hypothetical protein [Xanthobacteraceae bacterium]
MNLETIDWADLELRPAETLRGEAPNDWSDFQLKLGRPVVLEARKYFKDAETKDQAIELLKNESDFFYIRIPVSVKPSQQWGVGLLGVSIDLTNPQGDAEAWSMMPERVDDEQKLSISAKLSPSLKFSKAELSLGAVEAGSQFVAYQPHVYAYNLGTNNPAWEFTPTSGHQVRGIQLLHLVVRQPRKSQTKGKMHVTVELKRAGGLIWRLLGYRKGQTEEHVDFDIP